MRILTICFLVYVIGVLDGYCDNSTLFVATNKWQVVKKGQSIPKGLHVRHDLQTGVTEAKLLEENKETTENAEEEKIKSLSLHSDAVLHDAGNDLVLSIDELKEKLKKIKLTTGEDADSTGRQDEAKENSRNYQQLKKEAEALNINITTDSEIVTGIFKKFSNYEKSLASGTLSRAEVEGVLQIFNDLEFLLHQIDNAQLFADLGGMEKIISPCLNITNDDIKLQALIILGTSVQSNPKVQLKALNSDLVQKLLHTLTRSTKISLQSRCMFALGALVRGFPAAQKVLIDHGGLEIFGKILEDGHSQIQTRVMRLLTDLSIERQSLGKSPDQESSSKVLKAYQGTDFETKLLLHNYCKYLSNLMVEKCKEEGITQEFLEIVIENMITVSETCREEFQNSKATLLEALDTLVDSIWSQHRPKGTDSHDEMRQQLLRQISRLKSLISSSYHDEL